MNPERDPQQSQLFAQTAKGKTIAFKDLFFGTLLGVLFLAGIAQLFIDSDAENVTSAAMAMASSALVYFYLWKSKATTTHPLSSLSLLGMTVTTEFVALVSKSASLQSFTQFLRAPELTFGMVDIAMSIAVLVHFSYRNFKPLSNIPVFVATKLYTPIQAFKPPPVLALWIIGEIGLAAKFFGGGAMGDVGGKLLAGIAYLMILPFAIPIYNTIYEKKYCNIRVQTPFLIAHALGIIAQSIMSNGRGGIFAVPLQMGMLFLIYFLYDSTPLTKKLVRNITILLLLGAATFTSLADLATAMVIARDKLANLSKTELIHETIENFFDKQKLEDFRERTKTVASTELYDETYLGNPLLERLSETKYHDNMFYFASHLSDDERSEATSESLSRIVLMFPQEVLDAFDLKIDKAKYQYTMGDYYINLHHGANLGSYVIGSVWADLWVVSGPWFPLAFAIYIFLCFVVYDSLSLCAKSFNLAPVGMSLAFPIFLFGMGGDSISSKASFLFRDVQQDVLLYAALLAMVMFTLRLFTNITSAPVTVSPDDS